MKVTIAVTIVVMTVLATGCQGNQERRVEVAKQRDLEYAAARDACKADPTIRSNVALEKCQQEKFRPIYIKYEQRHIDLYDLLLAKRMFTAKRLDDKKITLEEANIESSKDWVWFNEERAKRDTANQSQRRGYVPRGIERRQTMTDCTPTALGGMNCVTY